MVVVVINLITWVANRLSGCNGRAKAATLSLDWFFDECREGGTIGLEHKRVILELGFEATDSEVHKKVRSQWYALSLSVSYYLADWKTGNGYFSPHVFLGIGFGLKAEMEWATTKYDLVVAKVNYPSPEFSSSIYAQAMGRVDVAFLSFILKLRAGEVNEASFGLGAHW